VLQTWNNNVVFKSVSDGRYVQRVCNAHHRILFNSKLVVMLSSHQVMETLNV